MNCCILLWNGGMVIVYFLQGTYYGPSTGWLRYVPAKFGREVATRGSGPEGQEAVSFRFQTSGLFAFYWDHQVQFLANHWNRGAQRISPLKSNVSLLKRLEIIPWVSRQRKSKLEEELSQMQEAQGVGEREREASSSSLWQTNGQPVVFQSSQESVGVSLVQDV